MIKTKWYSGSCDFGCLRKNVRHESSSTICFLDLFDCFPCRRIKPKVLQNRFYADSGYDRELRAFCLETRWLQVFPSNFWWRSRWVILEELEQIWWSAPTSWANRITRYYNYGSFGTLCVSGLNVLRSCSVTEEKGITYQTFWTLTANPHVLATGRSVTYPSRNHGPSVHVLPPKRHVFLHSKLLHYQRMLPFSYKLVYKPH